MGSCVSKKAAARAGAVAKETAPLPPEKEVVPPPPPPPPPPAVVVVVEEEVKEVLSETAVPMSRPPRPPEPDDKEGVKRRNIDPRKEEVEEEFEEASDQTASAEKAKAKAKGGGGEHQEQEVEQMTKAVRAGRRRTTPEKRRPPKDGNGRARSPSPRRQQGQQCEHAPPRPPQRREQQPPVVSGIGCRSGRFSPSAARRAAESAAVRRTNSARMDAADMTLLPHSSAKRSLNGGGVSKRGDPGERSGRRPDSPTSKRGIPPTSPAAAIHRQSSLNGRSATLKTEQTKPQCKARDGSDESGLEEGREQDKQAAAGESGALGQNPSVAMECFIFL